MKKLMIAAAIVCAAAFANAAAVTWVSGNLKEPLSGSGKWSTVTLAEGTAYLYDISSSQYTTWLAALNSDLATGSKTIYDSMKNAKAIATSSDVSSKGAITLTDTRDVSEASSTTPANLYSAIIYSFKDGDDEWYIANVGYLKVTSTSVAKSLSNTGLKIGGGSSGTSITGWQAVESVPEPFSGTLALLGLGAIALRRKMKKAKKA